MTGGNIAPIIAFGYASMSVAVESGAHSRVRSVPNGWSDPKCTSTIGALERNAAKPEEIERERSSPQTPIQAGCRRRASSVGIHASQRR